MRTFSRVTVAALLSVAAPTPSAAQARAPLAQSLDATVLRAPETFAAGGRAHLVYELHLTNFLRAEVAITGIRVLDGDRPGEPIADVRGDALARSLGRPGIRGATDPRRIASATRVVAYFWIPLPPGSPRPQSLRHQVEMQVMGPAEPMSVAFEGARVAVADEEAVVIGPPLRGGPWVALYLPDLVGGHRTVYYAMDGTARIPGRFAIDWVRLGPNGIFAPDTAPIGERNGHGAEVLAVANGVVVRAMDDIADNEGTPAAAAHALENAPGNYIALDIGQGRFAFYEHLQHGSITVKSGDRVRRGQVIGRVGNSGSTSMGPHLHFHVSDAPSPLAAEGLPFAFDAFEVLGEFPSFEALRAGTRWTEAPQERAGLRRDERPGAMSVVRFSPSAEPEPPVSPPGELRAARAFWGVLDSVWKARDASAFRELFTEDASFAFVDRGLTLEPRAAIDRHFTDQFSRQAPDLRHVSAVRSVRTVASGVISGDVRVEVWRDGPEGTAPVLLRRFDIFTVMRRTGERWRIESLRAYALPVEATRPEGLFSSP